MFVSHGDDPVIFSEDESWMGASLFSPLQEELIIPVHYAKFMWQTDSLTLNNKE